MENSIKNLEKKQDQKLNGMKNEMINNKGELKKEIKLMKN